MRRANSTAAAAPLPADAQGAAPALARMRSLTIVAQDPAVRGRHGGILTTEVNVPAEELAAGPCGYRVHVIDYDGSTRTLYKPYEFPPCDQDGFRDPFRNPSDRTIREDPGFHAQNVYAIVMRTLWRFEYALGRRVSWGIRGRGHQLKVAPHAFADANAFYSDHDEALMFGYFPGHDGLVFTCLSHDVVAHETTHALIDGLRTRFTDPSSPDQAAFHEGFSDVVALLSVFSLRDTVENLLDRGHRRARGRGAAAPSDLIHERHLTKDALKRSVLLGMAEEMGNEMSAVRGQALRQSAVLEPSPRHLREEEFQEPHRRGEILVAAMMHAFLGVWTQRLDKERLGRIQGRYLDGGRVAEEGADAADYLLTMVIRALDYTPPVHLTFGDFLSAMLTADHEIRPDDSRFHFRAALRKAFASFGIRPASTGAGLNGRWSPPTRPMRYDRTHFESMSRDYDEVFRFVWENRVALGLFPGAYSRIQSVRPCVRIAPEDGFPLRETVVECLQTLELEARELGRLGIDIPDGMLPEQEVTLQGGLTLIFDEYGRLKFAVSNQLHDKRRPEVQKRQSERLAYLWEYGHFNKGASLTRRFSAIHRMRAMGLARMIREEW